MSAPSARLWRWSPRILGILVSLFIAAFALDAFAEGTPLASALLDFFIHLIPAFVLLALVMVSRRWEPIAGVAFILLAVVYAMTMARGRLDWMLVISGPLAVVGVLFLWSWFRRSGSPLS